MKAGVAAMAHALLAVKHSGVDIKGRIVLDAVCDEEATGAGTKASVAAGRHADWAIITEPTNLDVLRYGNGQANFTVTFAGTAGHASNPEAGHNAIYDAAAFVAMVERAAQTFLSEQLGDVGPSYSVGRIDGGLRTSVIPARCSVGVDRRIGPSQSVREAVADLDALLRLLHTQRENVRAERTVDIEYEPFEVEEASSVCLALGAAASDVTGRRVEFAGLRATSDAVFLAEAGIPTVVFGPGSIEQAPKPNEYVPIDQVKQATRALALTMADLLS